MKWHSRIILVLLLILVISPFMGATSDHVLIIAGILAAVGVYRLLWPHLRKPAIGPERLVGLVGTAVTPLSPEGQVEVEGVRWIAEAEGGPIESGTKVVVNSYTGLKLQVRRNKE